MGNSLSIYLPVFHHYSLNQWISPDASGQQQPSSVGAQQHSGASDPGPIRATAPMWRCSRIMHMQRELHPTLLSSLEGIVDQMVWFRENWHEEVRRTRAQLCASHVKTEWVSKWIRWWKKAGCENSNVTSYVWKQVWCWNFAWMSQHLLTQSTTVWSCLQGAPTHLFSCFFNFLTLFC